MALLASARGQIGKWVALVFILMVAIGILAVYMVSRSPENYRPPAPPAFAVQGATGEFGAFELGGFGLRRVVLIVKSTSDTPTDLNELTLRLFIDNTAADQNGFGPYKVRNVLHPEKTSIEKNDVIEFDVNVARPHIGVGKRVEFKFEDRQKGLYVSNAAYHVPETKERFESLPR